MAFVVPVIADLVLHEMIYDNDNIKLPMANKKYDNLADLFE